MSSLLGLLLLLFTLTLVLHVVGKVLRVPVAADSCHRRPWLPTHWREPLEEGEPVSFTTDDGACLDGTFLHQLTDNCRGTIVYSHELNGDRWNALPYVEHLRAEGFDVFTFDYRSHGRRAAGSRWDPSVEVTETDIADLKAAVRTATQKSQQAEPVVGIIGVGKGAAVALCAAGSEPAVRALVLDSIRPLSGSSQANHNGVFSNWWESLRQRFLPAHSPALCDITEAAKNMRLPVLLIHGRNDVHVRLEQIRTLASEVAGQCQLWVVPGARHAEPVDVDRKAYRKRTSTFLTQSLRTKPARPRKAPQQTPTQERPAQVVHHGSISSLPVQ